MSPDLRLRVDVRGSVQGVGFRPFVYRLASELGLTGWVLNNPQGVQLEVEGRKEALERFLLRLEPERPPNAVVQSVEATWLDAAGHLGFVIRPSETGGARMALILPDLAVCADCLAEMFDATNRRYRYPFLNCTHCGPRYSIIERLPYDRPNTAMGRFTMCAACRTEYDDPLHRRFHAQPTACADCGPQLNWRTLGDDRLVEREAALQSAVEAIRRGEIVALKGLGGFQLLVDARDETSVRRLRERKRRESKPLAIMAPDMESLRALCDVSDAEERMLRSPQAPIVLLDRRDGDGIAGSVAPGSSTVGVMLPYTPLHALLMRELGFPVVATSGNRSEEPICTNVESALERLAGIADGFLDHDRPIVRYIDDSVARVVMDRELTLRRARGYAPLPIRLPAPVSSPILAVGAHLKNTVALAVEDQAFLSQHIGDLSTVEAVKAFRRAASDLPALYDAPPACVACDLHPDFASSRYADELDLPAVRVQHHHAHVLACMVENGIGEEPVLGVSWDGTGYGTDGAIWGGEFLIVEGTSWHRAAHLRPFRLPGGEAAIREPARTALALLHEVGGASGGETDDLPPIHALGRYRTRLLLQMLDQQVNAPMTTSAGRLFDGISALIGVRQISGHEGQAAMELEAAAESQAHDGAPYHLPIRRDTEDGTIILDWGPLVLEAIADFRRGIATGRIAARFHHALADSIVAVAREVGIEAVALTGGCFLNRLLLTESVSALRSAGFRPYWHQRVPPGDGGIALGQLAAAAMSRGDWQSPQDTGIGNRTPSDRPTY